MRARGRHGADRDIVERDLAPVLERLVALRIVEPAT